MKTYKTMSVTSKNFPESSFKDLISMILGTESFNKWKAVISAIHVAEYLMQFFVEEPFSSKGIKTARVSKKAIAEALIKISTTSSEPSIKSFEIPIWLLPVLLNLIVKWVESTYDKPNQKG